MAKYLMMTGPYDGHIAPCVPIVRKLIECGNEVVWITGRRYQGRVEATGARFHPVPLEGDPNGRDVYDFYPELSRRKGIAQIKWWLKHVFLDACVRDIETIDAVLTDFPADVLVGDSVAIGLYFRSEMGGPPSACISLLPASLPSRDTAPYGLGRLPGKNVMTRTYNRLLNTIVQQGLLRDVTIYANAVRRDLGLGPLRGPFLSAVPRAISLIMQISTPAFEYPRSDQPEGMHFIGPVLPETNHEFEPPAWWGELGRSRSVILVNQGTIATVLDDLIVPAVKGLHREDVLVVAVPVRDGQLKGLAENVCVEPFVPFDHLLPHVHVMVTNGGYGGTQMALAQGIPVVVAGETEDKREVAARVEWSGAGINLKKQRPAPEEVRKAVMEVLRNPTYRNNAERIQADFAQYDAPTRAVELLESLARG